MKVALTVHQGRVAPLFDAAHRLLLVTFRGGSRRRREEILTGETPLHRAEQVVQTGADELVCGAISAVTRAFLAGWGVRVLPWVTGDVDTVIGMIAGRDATRTKVAVSAAGPDPASEVDPRFGRAPWILVVEPETGEFEAIPNERGAGPWGPENSPVRFVLDRRVGTVITGRLGPNARGTLGAAGVRIVTGARGRVTDVVREYRAGGLRPEGASPLLPGGGRRRHRRARRADRPVRHRGGT